MHQKGERPNVKLLAQKFVSKASQVIIQSRSCCQSYTNCKISPSSDDWFNLSLQTDPEVDQCVDDIPFSEIFGCLLVSAQIHLSILINSAVVLERWSIVWRSPGCPASCPRPAQTTDFQLYSLIGRLLRSVVTTCRALPLYQQCIFDEDSYRGNLHYQFEYVELDTGQLGQCPYHPPSTNTGDSCIEGNVGVLNVGHLVTLHGDMSVTVAFLKTLVSTISSGVPGVDKLLVQDIAAIEVKGRERPRSCVVPAFSTQPQIKRADLNVHKFFRAIPVGLRPSTSPTPTLPRPEDESVMPPSLDSLLGERTIALPLLSTEHLASFDEENADLYNAFRLCARCSSLPDGVLPDERRTERVIDAGEVNRLEAKGADVDCLIAELKAMLASRGSGQTECNQNNL